MTNIQIGGKQYPAQITGYSSDSGWDGRPSKAITLTMTYEEAKALFTEDAAWSILHTDGEETTQYDNSEYSKAGPITDHRDGTVTVKMGKPTAEELLEIIMGG